MVDSIRLAASRHATGGSLYLTLAAALIGAPYPMREARAELSAEPLAMVRVEAQIGGHVEGDAMTLRNTDPGRPLW
jgi:hypothetical protein